MGGGGNGAGSWGPSTVSEEGVRTGAKVGEEVPCAGGRVAQPWVSGLGG